MIKKKKKSKGHHIVTIKVYEMFDICVGVHINWQSHI